ncbi:MAG TPA: hypothetical protein VH136_18770 [Trebonia sp.]|jgi:hypothetical protein|nr:hypothetical protein [Trebonia sp.]
MADDALTAGQLADWERRFGELTEPERELLTAAGPSSTIDGQRRYVLRMFMNPMRCPACLRLVPARQALGHAIHHKVPGDRFTCPHCRRELERVVPFIGSESWRLKYPLGPATDEELAAAAAQATGEGN